MKVELPTGKPQLPSRRKASSLVPLVAFVILLTIPFYYISIRDTSKTVYESLNDSFKPENFDFDQNCNFRFGDCKYGEDWINDPTRSRFVFTQEEEATVELERTQVDDPYDDASDDETISKQPEKPHDVDPAIHETIKEFEKTLNKPKSDKRSHRNRREAEPQVQLLNLSCVHNIRKYLKFCNLTQIDSSVKKTQGRR